MPIHLYEKAGSNRFHVLPLSPNDDVLFESGSLVIRDESGKVSRIINCRDYARIEIVYF